MKVVATPSLLSAAIAAAPLLVVAAPTRAGAESAAVGSTDETRMHLAAAQGPAQAPAAAAVDQPADAPEEIVVTGSRLQTTGGFNAPTPVSFIGADQLEARGAVSINDVLQEIPVFDPTGQSQGVSGTFAVGQAILDLRGLGDTRTLVLVDGRRPVPNNIDGTFDTNMIPSTLIERTEIVTGGASAAYGSDAVAGVVNFILKDRLEGLKSNVQYGISDAGDTEELSVSLGYGTDFADGRGHLIVGGEVSRNDPSGFMYNRDWGRREPGLLPLPASRPHDLPAFLVTEHVQYAMAPGSLVTSCVANGVLQQGALCPVYGTTFDADGQPYAFEFGPLVGSTLMQGPPGEGRGNYGFSTASTAMMKVGGERYAFLGRANFDLTPGTTVFAQVGAGRFQVESRGTYFNREDDSILINRDNPFLPDSLAQLMDAQGITQLGMNRINAKKGSVDPKNISEFRQGTVGASGTVFGDWTWDVHYTAGVGEFEYNIGGIAILPNYYASLYAVAGPDGEPVCGPSASNPNWPSLTTAQQAALQPGCVPANPFGIDSISEAAYDYANPRMIQKTHYRRDVAAVNLAGEPFSLWAGPLSVAAGVEWRKDDARVSVDPTTEALSIASAFFAVNPRSGGGDISVTEGYLEAGVPLARDAALARSLDLNAAIRYTDYSTSGEVATWKVGGTWEPVDFLRFRVTRSRDIRAPNIPELFIRGNESFGLRTNPLTGVSAQLNGQNVNNPGLQPEKANTWTAGIIFQPTWGWLDGLKASLDWYSIEIQDVIGSISIPDVLHRYYILHDESMAQYIDFDNSPIGFSRVNAPLLNLEVQKTSGVDIEVAYGTALDFVNLPGAISVNLHGNLLSQHERFDETGDSLGDLAGYIPKRRWLIGLTYSLDRFTASLQVRRSSQMKYRINRSGPEDPNYTPCAPDPDSGLCTVNNSISDNVFPAATYYSLSASFQLRNVELYGVIDNLLDKDPPGGSWAIMSGLGTGGSGGFNPYDGIGRYFKVGLRAEF